MLGGNETHAVADYYSLRSGKALRFLGDVRAERGFASACVLDADTPAGLHFAVFRILTLQRCWAPVTVDLPSTPALRYKMPGELDSPLP